MRLLLAFLISVGLSSCGFEIPTVQQQQASNCTSVVRHHHGDDDDTEIECPVANLGPTPTPADVPPGATPPPSVPMPGGPKLVVFHIVQGTGDGPWNTVANPVVAKVGDTLRVYNDDTTGRGKQIHASGKPFNHAATAIAAGAFKDYLISQIADPTVDRVYNHLVGNAARLYIRAER